MQRAFTRRMNLTGARRQGGVVLLIALIVLVAMTLAGIGMMRSIDSGTLVAGNIGFREAAVASADTGVEAARTWLVNNYTALNTDNPAAGYYSTRQDSLDLTGNMTEGGHDGVNWGGSDPTQLVTAYTVGTVDTSGTTVYYLIHRLCSTTGAIGPPNTCAYATVSQSGSTQSSVDYNQYQLTSAVQAYYRITVRVNGAKNTVSYVQAIVLI